jgi:type IV pilus assembly protein PilP
MKSLVLLLPFIASIALAQAPRVDRPVKPSAQPQSNQAPAMAKGEPSDVSGAESSSSTMFQGIMDPFEYDQRGRRDPFVQPVPDKPVEQGNIHGPLLALQKFELSQLALVGIIWDVKRPKAMIKDPTGTTHVVGTNTKVGPRNIAVIREGEMVVVETQEQDGKLVSSAQVVKIAR